MIETVWNWLLSQLNLKENAPQISATVTGAIGTALGLAVDDPLMAVIGSLVGAVLGWAVQKLYTVPKSDLQPTYTGDDLTDEDLEASVEEIPEWPEDDESEDFEIIDGEEVEDFEIMVDG